MQSDRSATERGVVGHSSENRHFSGYSERSIGRVGSVGGSAPTGSWGEKSWLTIFHFGS